MAREHLFKPASAIVNKVLLDEIPDDDPCPAIAKPENMARAANRLRQQLRPEDPTDLQFKLSKESGLTVPLDPLTAAPSLCSLSGQITTSRGGSTLNRRSGNKVHLPFYLLVELLHQESHLVSIQIRLVSDGKLSRIQRKKYWQLQERVFKHWEDFNFKEISARRLLKLCSYLNGPVGRSEDAPIYLPWLKFTFNFQRGRCQSDTHTSPHVIRLLEVPIYLP